MLSESEIEKLKTFLAGRSKVAYCFLFGSSLNGTSLHHDIDLLIGGDLSEEERGDLTSEIELLLGSPIDLVLSEKARCEVALRALSSGRPVLIRDRERLKEDYFRNFRLCEQKIPLRRVRLERLKRVYTHG